MSGGSGRKSVGSKLGSSSRRKLPMISAWESVASRPRLGPPYKVSVELRRKMNEKQSACPFGIAMVNHFVAAHRFWFYLIGGVPICTLRIWDQATRSRTARHVGFKLDICFPLLCDCARKGNHDPDCLRCGWYCIDGPAPRKKLARLSLRRPGSADCADAAEGVGGYGLVANQAQVLAADCR